MNQLVSQIKSQHPGTPVYNLAVFNDAASFQAIPTQVASIEQSILAIVKANATVFKDGYHLLCHSQGGLICRSLTHTMDTHNVDTLISLAGPQLGVYDEGFFKIGGFFPVPFSGKVVDEVYKLAYTTATQATLSIANMWNDPNHQSEFFNSNVYLPFINNLVDHADAKRYKANFLRLKKAVFISGDQGAGKTYDGGIGPWNSGIFGFVGTDGKTLIPMEKQDFYINDTFGLRTLDEQGKLILLAPSKVSHTDWVLNKNTINQYAIPYLS
jgi:palmitoyl-protein thioesterase